MAEEDRAWSHTPSLSGDAVPRWPVPPADVSAETSEFESESEYEFDLESAPESELEA